MKDLNLKEAKSTPEYQELTCIDLTIIQLSQLDYLEYVYLEILT